MQPALFAIPEEVMAAERNVYHVLPASDEHRWVITRETDAFIEEHGTREDAVEAARGYARADAPWRVKVHGMDGSLDYEVYGVSPRRLS
jgi:hypothetical protein